MKKLLKVAETWYQAILRLVSDGLEEAMERSMLQYQIFLGLGDRSKLGSDTLVILRRS